jgi:hypothetical protein
LSEFPYVRDHQQVLQAHSATCAYFFPGRDRDYQTLNLTFAANVAKYGAIIGMFPKPLKLYVIVPIRVASFTRTHFSIVSRMLSSIPSQIRQEMEFIRPMVEERFAKMEEFGDDWDDKPVCRTIISGISHVN